MHNTGILEIIILNGMQPLLLCFLCYDKFLLGKIPIHGKSCMISRMTENMNKKLKQRKHDIAFILRAAAKLTTMCRALITHIPTVIVSITQVWTWDANVGWLTLCVFWLAGSLSWDHHKGEHTVFTISNNCDYHLRLMSVANWEYLRQFCSSEVPLS